MNQQTYQNHVRYYPAHHFVFYPVLLIATVLSARMIFKSPGSSAEWMAVTGLFLMIGWLAFMLRQHYALNNQNRIVRLELRLRYYILTNKRMEEIEAMLSFNQLAALRFAPDEELVMLIERTLQENLTPTEIKRAVKNWLPDHMRV